MTIAFVPTGRPFRTASPRVPRRLVSRQLVLLAGAALAAGVALPVVADALSSSEGVSPSSPAVADHPGPMSALETLATMHQSTEHE